MHLAPRQVVSEALVSATGWMALAGADGVFVLANCSELELDEGLQTRYGGDETGTNRATTGTSLNTGLG